MNTIKINDLNRKIEKYRHSLETAFSLCLDKSHFVLGTEVQAFEKEFAAYLNCTKVISVGNGTDAIEIALKAGGISAKSKIAIAANAGNYAATAAQNIGCQVEFMDVEYETRNITLAEVKRAINLGVHAVVATHLYGLAISEISEISDYCKIKGVFLIEDCAQACGAEINGKRVGTFGNAGTFSFYPTKNLGALGDGGAIATSDLEIASGALKLRTYGWNTKYHVEVLGGMNSRLDEIQASFLRIFLKYLDDENAIRRDIAQLYSSKLQVDYFDLQENFGPDYVAHLYVLSSSHRDHYLSALKEANIGHEIHYPVPDHKQATSTFTGQLKITEELASKTFSIPCYPELIPEELEYIISTLNSATLELSKRTSAS